MKKVIVLLLALALLLAGCFPGKEITSSTVGSDASSEVSTVPTTEDDPSSDGFLDPTEDSSTDETDPDSTGDGGTTTETPDVENGYVGKFKDYVAKSFASKPVASLIPEKFSTINKDGLSKNLKNLNFIKDSSPVIKQSLPTKAESEYAGDPFAIQAKYDDGMETPIAIYDVVRDFGAVGDGVTDNSEAINAALMEAQSMGGGTVFIPEGRYYCKDQLIIPSSVCLRGDWQSPEVATPASTGTILIVSASQIESDSSFIFLCANSGIRNLTVIYEKQSVSSPTKYSPTVGIEKNKYFTVENVTILGAYDGIQMGPAGNEIYYLHNVYIAALHWGVYNSGSSDIGRMENVNMDPAYWTQNALYRMTEQQKSQTIDYFRKNAIGIAQYMNDWSYQTNIMVKNYHIGLYFGKIESGNAMNGQYMQVDLINCDIGIYIQQTKIAGIVFTDVNITTSVPATAGIYTSNEYNGTCQFMNTVINGPFKTPVLSEAITSRSSSGALEFVSSKISGYDDSKNYAVVLKSGALTFQKCTFAGKKKHVSVAAGASSLSMLGCTYGGSADISIAAEARDDVDIDNEPISIAETSGRQHVYRSSIPKPTSRNIYNVIDYGASSFSNDNTKAVQAALDAAKATGGTVYIPGGEYVFKGTLSVPSGVELRGSYDMQTGIGKGGTILYPYSDKGNENGTPFITLAGYSGARNFSVYYPEQTVNGIVAYPWTIRGMGENVWAVNINLSNVYNGIDFGTRPSKGHYIDFISGSPLRRGIFVGNNSGNGWVQNVQFNPNYAVHINGIGTTYKEYQLYYCDAIILGDNASEHVFNTFVYGSKNGLMFMAQKGKGTNGTIVGHGTDGSECSLRVYQADVVEFMNLQLVAMASSNVKRNIHLEPTFTGTITVFNSLIWGPTNYQMYIEGGNAIFNQINLCTGFGDYYLRLTGGNVEMNSCTFHRVDKQITIADKAKSLKMLGNYTRNYHGSITVENHTSITVSNQHPWWA